MQLDGQLDARTERGRRAVVTGDAGFVGSHLCERLLADGWAVECLDNFLTSTPANVAHLLERPGFRLRRCDVTDYLHVPGAVDLVLHLASPASPIDYLQLPLQTLKVGSIGTWHTLGLAKEKGARFVLASTSEVYGDPQVHPQPEDYWGHVNPVGPRGVYDEAKRYAEAMTTAYRTSEGVDTAIVRIFNTNPDERSVLDLAREVLAATGSRSPITFVGRPADDPEVRRPDTALARLLGWEPRVPWSQGLARTVAWFREQLSVSA